MPAASEGRVVAPADPGTRPQRLALGIFVLLIVDVIWVASSEFTEYIFNDLGPILQSSIPAENG
jgi:hypothetical protein